MEGLEFLPPRNNEFFWQAVNESISTDLIELSAEKEEDLLSLWADPNKEEFTVPADILITNTVSIKDLTIHFTDADIKARVMIVEEPYYSFDFKSNVYGVIVMHILDSSGNTAIKIGTVIVIDEVDNVPYISCASNLAYRGNMNRLDEDAPLLEAINKAIGGWYGVQIALLHPVIKEYFKNPKVTKERIPKEERHNPKTVKRYIRRHYITEEQLAEAIYKDPKKKGKKRHAMCWHVIGHYRTYKNGRRIFIQPYWKGELRHLKQAEINKREVIINEAEKRHIQATDTSLQKKS